MNDEKIIGRHLNNFPDSIMRTAKRITQACPSKAAASPLEIIWKIPLGEMLLLVVKSS